MKNKELKISYATLKSKSIHQIQGNFLKKKKAEAPFKLHSD